MLRGRCTLGTHKSKQLLIWKLRQSMKFRVRSSSSPFPQTSFCPSVPGDRQRQRWIAGRGAPGLARSLLNVAGSGVPFPKLQAPGGKAELVQWAPLL